MAEIHMPADQATEIAQRLLAAAAELGLPASVIETTSSGVFGLSFIVPDEVFDRMVENTSDEEPEPEQQPEPEKPKKKVGRPRKVVPVAEEVTDGE